MSPNDPSKVVLRAVDSDVSPFLSGWRRSLALVVIFVLLLAFGYVLGSKQNISGVDNPSLEIDGKHLNFGQAWSQHEFDYVVPLKNNVFR